MSAAAWFVAAVVAVVAYLFGKLHGWERGFREGSAAGRRIGALALQNLIRTDSERAEKAGLN